MTKPIYINALQNPDCCNSLCIKADGEVRILPLGGGANLTLCLNCFNHEMRYRRDRIKEGADPESFKVKQWSELRVYDK